MKTTKLLWIKSIAAAVVLLLADRVQALYTPQMIAVSNGIAAYSQTITNPIEARVVARVLKDFSRPSTSVAQDYSRFLAGALHLGPFALQEPFGSTGSNVFAFFMNEAAMEIGVTTARIGALNDFVRTKRSASNQLAQAYALLVANATEPNVQLALLRGQLIYKKLVVAQKLTAIGEAHPGFAPDSLVDGVLEHQELGRAGMVTFLDATNATQSEDGGPTESATYTYTRTGLNKGTVVINSAGGSTTTVNARFTSAEGGRFTFRFMDSTSHASGSGRFTLMFP
jgi:hypothetical protein